MLWLPVLIFVATILLVVFKPRPFNEAGAICLGVFLMLFTGIISLSNISQIFSANLNILLFFFGLMLVSYFAELSGFFSSAANLALKLSKGNSWRLLGLVFALGIIITMFMSNDATALLLTPVVFMLVSRYGLKPLPYVFACAFVANTASMIFPFSNPVNLLAVDKFNLSLSEYLTFMLIPSLLAITITIAIFYFVFRRDLTPRFSIMENKPVALNNYSRSVRFTLIFLAAGCLLTSFMGWPLAIPLMVTAFILLGITLVYKKMDFNHLRHSVSWSILPFVLGLAFMVNGLENAGLTTTLGNWLSGTMASGGQLETGLITSFGTAIGSNLINNWPMMMVSVSSLSVITDISGGNAWLVYQAILGADLGPNLLIMGSLSTMLWLILLRKRGLTIKPVDYTKLGLLITPPVLLISTLAIFQLGKLSN
ncbi:ArsB/NhaD family transporter [Dehalococcoides mccartyi]|uniref:Anion permease, ArsB-like protein n=1 Tax=Dehalococcoides mccartyi (strain VS) TaxID=311424 RepID=D2BHW0_DEHMV|nr:ArsB/NhaD family transporter [Dehalococcoides mccartyi]ACZ61910.1 anion permease, ArsB-like protein [Dehalococcoides mccartyi VS]